MPDATEGLDEVFYPDGVGAWMAKLDARVGGLVSDPGFFPHSNDFRGHRVHQIRFQGGDASSNSYCFAS
jgi:methanethiol oxidase